MGANYGTGGGERKQEVSIGAKKIKPNALTIIRRVIRGP